MSEQIPDDHIPHRSLACIRADLNSSAWGQASSCHIKSAHTIQVRLGKLRALVLMIHTLPSAINDHTSEKVEAVCPKKMRKSIRARQTPATDNPRAVAYWLTGIWRRDSPVALAQVVARLTRTHNLHPCRLRPLLLLVDKRQGVLLQCSTAARNSHSESQVSKVDDQSKKEPIPRAKTLERTAFVGARAVRSSARWLKCLCALRAGRMPSSGRYSSSRRPKKTPSFVSCTQDQRANYSG